MRITNNQLFLSHNFEANATVEIINSIKSYLNSPRIVFSVIAYCFFKIPPKLWFEVVSIVFHRFLPGTCQIIS